MGNRLIELRKMLGLSQEAFGTRLGVTKSTISNIETGRFGLTDTMALLICSEFQVSEVWLREGKGDVFTAPETFSLDEYANQNQLSALEVDLIKALMEIDRDVRTKLIAHFRSRYAHRLEEAHIAAEVEQYRSELRAELKGEAESSASPVTNA